MSPPTNIRTFRNDLGLRRRPKGENRPADVIGYAVIVGNCHWKERHVSTTAK
jgi:hypothetical protein